MCRDETVIFGGCLIDHFGHALLDGTARMWYLTDAPDDKKIVFLRYPKTSHASFDALKFVELMGIDMNRVEIITEPTQFRRVIVPDETMYPADAYRPEYIRTFDHIVKRIQPHTDSRIYLSRRKFGFRTSLNEQYYEEFFAARGFTIIYPETLPIEDQIAYIAGADEIVTTMGSMAHLLLFAKPTVNATILNRSGQCLPGQIMVDQVRGIEPYFVDAYCNPLPVPHVDGPFLFGPNRFFRAYLDERGINYEPDELRMDSVQMRELSDAFMTEWGRMYANPKKRKSPGTFTRQDIAFYAEDHAEYYAQYVEDMILGDPEGPARLFHADSREHRFQTETDRLKTQIAELKKTNAKLKTNLQKSRDEVKRLRNSKSWKITAPLRAVMRKLGAGES